LHERFFLGHALFGGVFADLGFHLAWRNFSNSWRKGNQ
jgi:hypothetical protein